jgi:hypothetical protein
MFAAERVGPNGFVLGVGSETVAAHHPAASACKNIETRRISMENSGG